MMPFNISNRRYLLKKIRELTPENLDKLEEKLAERYLLMEEERILQKKIRSNQYSHIRDQLRIKVDKAKQKRVDVESKITKHADWDLSESAFEKVTKELNNENKEYMEARDNSLQKGSMVHLPRLLKGLNNIIKPWAIKPSKKVVIKKVK